VRAAALGGLGLLLLLGGCQAERQARSGFGPTVRVCQGAECREVLTAQAVADQTDRRSEPASDPDLYRGEDPAALRAAAEGGDPRAAYLLGQVEEYGLGGRPRRPAEAARWYGVAAEAGNPWAQFRLAQLHERGQGVARSPRRALELTAAAAGAGHARAAHNLGTAYLSGTGVPRDAAEGARWLNVAAEGGVAEAQYNLAVMYLRGEGMPRELYRGLTWMRQAASNGHGPAQKAVGRIYMTGLDTMGQDLTEAKTWLRPVAARGDRDAQRWLAEIERAEREELDFQRALALRAAETQALIAGAIFAAALQPPPVVYVSRW
jgi:TPR repeat protein